MRDRRPHDWTADLTGRHRLEAEVASALLNNGDLRLLERNTHRFDRLDYAVATGRVPFAAVELKAKWQRYKGWQKYRPDVQETDLFILDELALRRIVSASPDGHLLIYDHPQGRWVIFSVVDLMLAPKSRVSRQIGRSRSTLKGKLLIDLNDGLNAGRDLRFAIDRLVRTIDNTHRRWAQVEPWPKPGLGIAS